MKAARIRELDNKEMKSQLESMDEQLFRLKFQLEMGQTDGLKKLRELKRDKARMLTILRERELEAAKGKA